MGFFPTKDMQTPPLRSGHLCIKDAQYAQTKEKLYLRFFRYLVFELLASKRLTKDSQKIRFSSNVAKFTGKIRIDLTMIFRTDDFFCAILSFCDMIDFVFFPL